MLRDREWAPSYTTDDGSLAEQFYTPVLTEAVEYNRGTGYFGAGSLALSMRGIEGLIRNGGRMRLLVGCTLDAGEVEAIRRGESLRRQVERNLCRIPLDAPDPDTAGALELLSWMIASGHMEIKVAVRCNDKGEPVENPIYHKKLGVVRDSAGDKLAWNGSDNETPSGRSANSELLTVFTSWDAPKHQRDTEARFEEDWSGRGRRLKVMDIPRAVRQNLLKYAPPEGHLPARLKRQDTSAGPDPDMIWSFISQAHGVKNGFMVGLATAPVRPWPHQVQVFRRLRDGPPARLLIADEVGLGKTIQAGLFVRQAWLEGRRRILVMAPAGLTKQWQKELHEKLNLDWPIYDGRSLVWQDTHAGGRDRTVQPDIWTEQGPVIISSHLARRDERALDITSTRWDVVVLDEAHYARQTNPNNPDKHTPNKMLRLMRSLKGLTEDLILLTATPMQLHPVELYDLLDLLGLPGEWSWDNFERFYGLVDNPDEDNIKFMGRLFRASEEMYGPVGSGTGVSKMQRKKALSVLRGEHDKRLYGGDYRTIRRMLLMCSPVTRLVSRNTRKQLREYIKANNLDWRLGTRRVDDRFVAMNCDERRTYDAVSDYISDIWNTCGGTDRQAVGFALTIYRKRLASSFAALKKTLENHLGRLEGVVSSRPPYEDEYDDADVDEIAENEEAALKELDRQAVCRLLDMIRTMPPDTKFDALLEVIAELKRRGYEQVMLFTQFTDTMDFLRERLGQRWRVMCYSGRHGERPRPGGGWEQIGRDETKRMFLEGSAEILVCTDAAAEGLNFQFCGAMINYDMPWNPMRVEQRIGRIDRIGQKHDSICIVNMYYEDTIEADVYRALGKRIHLFEDVVGPLQPILSSLDDKIKRNALERGSMAVHDAERMLDEVRTGRGLDLDSMLAADTTRHELPESPVTLDDLDRIVGDADIMSKYKMAPGGKRQYNIVPASGKPVRVTTDPDLFDAHGDSMEFWSPGSPTFPVSDSQCDISKYGTLKQLLDHLEQSY